MMDQIFYLSSHPLSHTSLLSEFLHPKTECSLHLMCMYICVYFISLLFASLLFSSQVQISSSSETPFNYSRWTPPRVININFISSFGTFFPFLLFFKTPAASSPKIFLVIPFVRFLLHFSLSSCTRFDLYQHSTAAATTRPNLWCRGSETHCSRVTESVFCWWVFTIISSHRALVASESCSMRAALIKGGQFFPHCEPLIFIRLATADDARFVLCRRNPISLRVIR